MGGFAKRDRLFHFFAYFHGVGGFSSSEVIGGSGSFFIKKKILKGWLGGFDEGEQCIFLHLPLFYKIPPRRLMVGKA